MDSIADPTALDQNDIVGSSQFEYPSHYPMSSKQHDPKHHEMPSIIVAQRSFEERARTQLRGSF